MGFHTVVLYWWKYPSNGAGDTDHDPRCSLMPMRLGCWVRRRRVEGCAGNVGRVSFGESGRGRHKSRVDGRTRGGDLQGWITLFWKGGETLGRGSGGKEWINRWEKEWRERRGSLRGRERRERREGETGSWA